LSNTETEILDALAACHVTDKRPEPLRGHVVVDVIERLEGESGQPKTLFNRGANIRKKARER